MRDKQFLLGVGCQKGGTSWLHAQLQKSAQVDMGFAKEYHVFDALYLDECRHFMKSKLKMLKGALRDIDNLSREHSQLLTHINFYLDTDNYFDYFDCLWHRGTSEITTVGDISPPYGALPVVALQAIKDELEARGFRVKVMFLMRDPVERCWSMVRMNRRNARRKNPDAPLKDEQTHLRNFYRSSQCEIRTRYELTIRNLESVFRPESIYYGFYESLFEKRTLGDIKSFLNLGDFSPNTREKVNVSEKTEHVLQESLAAEIFEYYRDTYAYWDARFGVRALWNGWDYS